MFFLGPANLQLPNMFLAQNEMHSYECNAPASVLFSLLD